MGAKHVLVSVGLLLAAGTSACAPLAAGALATGGVTAAQERSVGNAIDDLAVQSAIIQRFYDSSETAYRQINLEVVEGRVLMTGRVADQDRRIEAVRIAWSTPGVAEVINELNIQDDSIPLIRPRDAWIVTQLRTRLMADEHVRQLNYHIEILNGTVYLFGIAWDQDELARAESHARAIRGVTSVISHVRFRDEPLPIRSQGA